MVRIKRKLELRDTGKRVEGVIIQEGRAASERREVFAPGAVRWSSSGIDLLGGHGGKSVAVAFPVREPNGAISISVPATQPVRDAMSKYGSGLSVEFMALEERRTGGGIREITRAYVDAAAFVSSPEYTQAKAEIRKRRRRWI